MRIRVDTIQQRTAVSIRAGRKNNELNRVPNGAYLTRALQVWLSGSLKSAFRSQARFFVKNRGETNGWRGYNRLQNLLRKGGASLAAKRERGGYIPEGPKNYGSTVTLISMEGGTEKLGS